MGLAWLDYGAPRMDEVALRTGGLPLMPAGAEWPECPACGLPLLFRAQVPLAMTSLVPFDDDRLLLLFECHAVHDDGACDGTHAVIVSGALRPREAPPPTTCDVVLRDEGEHPLSVARILRAIDGNRGTGRMVLPATILRGMPVSIARATSCAIASAGGAAGIRPTAPTQLGTVRGGRVVPFDDGPGASYRTTLPPLDALAREMRRDRIRGLMGGTPGAPRDSSYTCACARPMRTAVRLLAHHESDPDTGVLLGAAAAHVCLRCSRAALYRPQTRARCSPAGLCAQT
jgi:hypothetical protein